MKIEVHHRPRLSILHHAFRLRSRERGRRSSRYPNLSWQLPSRVGSLPSGNSKTSLWHIAIPVAGAVHRIISGRRNRHVSTSLFERSNLTFRMQQPRFARLTSGFSKILENHRAAVASFVAHYNLRRVHESLQGTPAMALGVTEHIWDIGEPIETASTSFSENSRTLLTALAPR